MITGVNLGIGAPQKLAMACFLFVSILIAL